MENLEEYILKLKEDKRFKILKDKHLSGVSESGGLGYDLTTILESDNLKIFYVKDEMCGQITDYLTVFNKKENHYAFSNDYLYWNKLVMKTNFTIEELDEYIKENCD